DLQTKGCQALIISPNTTDALTPAVDRACATGIPVIVFDRGVTTNCPVTFIHPIGGGALGGGCAAVIARAGGEGGRGLAPPPPPGNRGAENRVARRKGDLRSGRHQRHRR